MYCKIILQLENLRERIEEESEKKSDALKALSKASAEIQLWRSKFETEGLGRVEELEGSKTKISARVLEAEETIDSLNQKISATLEKNKCRIQLIFSSLSIPASEMLQKLVLSCQNMDGNQLDSISF